MATERSGDAVIPEPGRVATQRDFGRELTLLRRRSGLTVRQVAAAAGLPVSTVGDYFAGQHLPPASQPDVLPRVLGACGVTDADSLRAWSLALDRARRPGNRRADEAGGGPPGRGGGGPYLGLATFAAEDAEWFFGREELTARLARLAGDEAARHVPLVVVGASGSGKSSLLRAGLIPALERGHAADAGTARPARQRRAVLLTPGSDPVAALAAALSPAAGRSRATPPAWAGADGADGTDLPDVVVVDQFEETFTLCQDPAGQRAFIAAVARLAGPAVVVLGLRADYYVAALRHPELARALQDRQVLVGPMTREQVRRAIVEPARRAGLEIGEGLVELLLRDLAPRLQHGRAAKAARPAGDAPGHEPGALPLLSHALLATWRLSRDGRLSVSAYQASGGIREAVARSAESVYAALGTEERRAAQHLFLRLVSSTDEGEMRRRVPPGELAADPVLRLFVAARLITVSEDAAEISHDALLDAWPRLRRWLDESQDSRRMQRRIEAAAREWQEAGHDTAVLPRSGQLAGMREWAADPDHAASLSDLGRRFVAAGNALDLAEANARRRHTRRLRQLVGALTAAVLATVGLTGYAFAQRQSAAAARNDADSREVAIEASQLRGQDPSAAAQLSVAAYRIAVTPQATAGVLESSGTPTAARIIDSAGVVQAVALRPGGAVLAAAGADGTLRLWDIADPGHPVPLGRPLLGKSDSPLYTAAFSPDGSLLAAAGAGRSVDLWSVAGSRQGTRAAGTARTARPARTARTARPVPLRAVRLGSLAGPRNTVFSVAFSPDGTVLAAGSADSTVRLWDVADPRRPRLLATLAGPGGWVQAVAFSPDGRSLAAAGTGGRVRLWDVARPGRPVPLGKPLSGPAGPVTSLAFSPGGRLLAAGSQDYHVWLWNVAAPARPVRLAYLSGATAWVNSVTFSPGSDLLAAATSEGGTLVWDIASRRLMATLPSPGVATSAAWDGAHELITGGSDGTVRLWTMPPPQLAAAGPVNSVAYGPDGRLLAVGATDLELWDPLTRQELASAAAPGTFVNAVAYSPGGPSHGVVAAGYADGTVRLWAVRPGHGRAGPSLARVGPVLRATALTDQLVEYIAFSHDGRLLATGGDDGTVRLWNVTDPARPALLAVIRDSGTYVFSVSFSPGDRILAAGSADNLVRLWDIARPARPARIGRPLAGPSSYVYSVAFSPGGRVLAVGSADRTVRLWDVADPARPRLIGRPLTGPEGYVYSLAFAPGGTTLAAGSTDDSVWLWNLSDPASPGLIAQLTGPAGHVYSVAFSPGGREVAAGSADGTVRLWDASAAAAIRQICATAGQPLTRAEWDAYVPGRGYAPPCR